MPARSISVYDYPSLKSTYLYCRTFQHSWTDVTGIVPGPEMIYLHGRQIVLRCERCRTVRSDIYSPASGDLMDRHYRYPEGYSLGKWDGEGTLRMAMRVEYMTRKDRMDRKNKRGVGNGKAIAK